MKTRAIIFAFLLPVLAFAQPSGVRQADVVPGRTPDSPTFEEYFNPAPQGAVTTDEDGFIRDWVILEPIAKPIRSNTVFTDSYLRDVFSQQYFKGQLAPVLPKDGKKEKVVCDITPAGSMWVMPGEKVEEPKQVLETRKLQWRAVESKMFNVKLFRFAAGLQKDVYGVIFWMATVVECDEDIPNVRLAVGSNGASMWWINGEEALLMSADRRMVQDDCMSRRLTLRKGRNIIWGSVINGPGMSDCCVRFVDEDGNPVKNIKVYCR